MGEESNFSLRGILHPKSPTVIISIVGNLSPAVLIFMLDYRIIYSKVRISSFYNLQFLELYQWLILIFPFICVLYVFYIIYITSTANITNSISITLVGDVTLAIIASIPPIIIPQRILRYDGIRFASRTDPYTIWGPIILSTGLLVVSIRWLFEKGIIGQSRLLDEDNTKPLIRGMLEVEGKIDLTLLSSSTGHPLDFWKSQIYVLIGNGDINGTLEDNVFIPDEDESIDYMIDKLVKEFEEYEIQKFGKIET